MPKASRLIPIVLDDQDTLVWASDTLPKKHYRCPTCKEVLVRRDGAKKILHFAHTQTSSCNSETALHAAAKLAISSSISDWLSGIGLPPTIHSKCNGGDLVYVYDQGESFWTTGWNCSASIALPLKRSQVDQVFVETELESGLRPDVQIQHKGKPTLAIEIKVTHEVDDAKRSRLTLPWIELDAEAIIRDPHKWSPRQHNVSKVDQCAFCLQVDKERLVQTLAKDLRQWVMWWRNKFGKYPYVSDEIEHRQRTLTRLMRAQATSWKNRTGQELPGVLTIWGETTTLI